MNILFGMESKDIIMTAAVIIGPVLAVQIQKTLEQFRERKQSRLSIFRTLMSTRAQRLHREHVQALNMIDIEFYGRKIPIIKIRYQTKKEQTVTHAWKSYNSHLNKIQDYPDINIWISKSDDLFTDLLYALSQAMSYDFDKVQLQRDCYRPIAHGDLETTQANILKGLEKVFSGDTALPMFITNAPLNKANPDDEVVSKKTNDFNKESH
ncbi:MULTISPECIES: DUF6680 family protein [Enterobacter]|jgi:hypothetical protein|uniref:DUF6680 family protein n=1 Tax=Enterobacter TaxID=547 RepID=UPI0006970C2B|nr:MULTISPECIES: DUF6680 family protein [Enterobacter]ELN9581576.1 hypothetical protein [Enterobacter roggenkampii]KTI35635.1 hypothetical protein ASV07_11265 [Enterobacter roggenkampii]MBO4174124.1 hypothetical protein [Enterobacter roggenkampii]MCK6717493.1 hypothetical protein [Enterobacter roggenkampii]MCK7354135.1 hypothetical protein [Enterobacter roggenkampii]